LEVGETFRAQDFLLQIDETDYTAALANAEANLADARLAIALEEAGAEKAIRDWEKLGSGREAGSLVLRVPQLASAKARVLAAQGAVDKALADLDRARVVAPYNCRVVAKSLDLGATVAPGTPLLEVLSLGAVEVRLPLSLEDYGFLKRDDNGEVMGEVSATARIGGEARLWKGAVVRSAEVVEATTRSIDVVVRFEGDDTPPPGMFLSATIGGATLQGRVVLPRAAMLDARRVLLVKKDNTLEFRDVSVERTESDSVVIGEGLEPGERVCLTPLSTPVTGMKVEVIGEAAGSESDEREDTPKL
jgi:RND family efflux transporter MFP subunit